MNRVNDLLTLYERARLRVLEDARLKPHADLLVEQPWRTLEEHLRWVLEKEPEEVQDWAEYVKHDYEGQPR